MAYTKEQIPIDYIERCKNTESEDQFNERLRIVKKNKKYNTEIQKRAKEYLDSLDHILVFGLH